MSVSNLGPLDWRIPIVTSEGRPTQEFQRRWANQISNNSQIGSITIGSGPPPNTPAPADGAQYADTSTNPYTLYIGGGGVWNVAGSSGANPTATAGDVAVNGSANTYMRSDAAPAVQKASSSQFGIVKVDGTTITETGGVISAAGGGGGSNWQMVDLTGGVITTGVTYNFATTPVSFINVTGLGAYKEIIAEITDVTSTSSGFRGLRCSVDNGVSFFTSIGDYQDISTSGITNNNAIMDFHANGSSAARSGAMYCPNINMSIGPKYFNSWTEGTSARFSGSNLPVNAIQVSINAGNMNGGFLRVYVK